MSNGLGAGFFALTLLTVLAGLAGLSCVAALAVTGWHRRRGVVPNAIRYLLAALGVGIVGLGGFGVLVLIDESFRAAWLFVALDLAPFLVAGGYLRHRQDASRTAGIAATTGAWGGPFLLGLAVAFGVLAGAQSAFALAPVESRELRVAEFAFTVGGVAVAAGTVALGDRLLPAIGTTPTAADRRDR